jgi:hypothetical protein
LGSFLCSFPSNSKELAETTIVLLDELVEKPTAEGGITNGEHTKLTDRCMMELDALCELQRERKRKAKLEARKQAGEAKSDEGKDEKNGEAFKNAANFARFFGATKALEEWQAFDEKEFKATTDKLEESKAFKTQEGFGLKAWLDGAAEREEKRLKEAAETAGVPIMKVPAQVLANVEKQLASSSSDSVPDAAPVPPQPAVVQVALPQVMQLDVDEEFFDKD